MPRITISYRREDSDVITGRIFDRLAAHYGRDAVFRDIDNIPPGVDFRKHIDQVLEESDIILAVVGPKWIGPRANQNRLTNPADPVRLEMETALRKDKPLIPVLVLRASMPRVEQLPESIQTFAFRNAITIDAGQDFDTHVARLLRAMDRIIDVPTGTRLLAEPEFPANRALTPPELAKSEVALDYERFVGVWGGYWGGALASSLIVANVTAAGEFRAVYSWGTASEVPTPGASNVMGRIDGTKLSWGDPLKGIGFIFTILPDGLLQGERWDHGVQNGFVIMKKYTLI